MTIPDRQLRLLPSDRARSVLGFAAHNGTLVWIAKTKRGVMVSLNGFPRISVGDAIKRLANPFNR